MVLALSITSQHIWTSIKIVHFTSLPPLSSHPFIILFISHQELGPESDFLAAGDLDSEGHHQHPSEADVATLPTHHHTPSTPEFNIQSLKHITSQVWRSAHISSTHYSTSQTPS